MDVQLGRWEVANIRAIVRGKARDAPHDRIVSALLPVGRLGEPHLIELAGQPDLGAVADTLRLWDFGCAVPLCRAIREHRGVRDSVPIETALDRAYFEWALTELDPRDADENRARDMVQRQIDLVNLLSILRVVTVKERGGGVPQNGESPLPGGLLGLRRIRGICESATAEGAFGMIEETYFAPAIERGILAFGESGRLSVMERFLEAVVLEKGCRLYREDPLGSGVSLGYLWRKYNELLNLRILLRGLAHDVPVNMIREELVLV
jgi:vacuolar-type H+-ATPase subunit C/Vma6